jgi:hypothetical protein
MSESQLPSSFIAVLESLTVWLEAVQVPHATIGGVAVSLIAQPRMTQDIDAVIWLEENQWDAFLKSGADYGFAPRIADALEFARRARVLLLKHEPSEVSVDLSLGALGFEREMIERATTVAIGSLRLKVATPEDLIITKVVAQRSKDIADIEAILAVQPDLDHIRIRRWASEFAEALDMPELREILERLLGRHKSQGR